MRLVLSKLNSNPGVPLFSAKPIAVFPLILLIAAMAACGGGTSTTTNPQSPTNPQPPGGAVWQKVNTPSAVTQLNYVAFNSSNHWFIADRNNGFYRSTDQGATWTQINSGLTTTLGWTINVNPANGDLIASTYSGTVINANPVNFYRSTDEGNSWNVIPSGQLSAATAQTGCVFAANSDLVCGGYWAPFPNSGAWVSTNGGQSTISASTASTIGGSVYGLGLNPVTQDLWLGTEQNGILRSANNGLNWTVESPPATSFDPVHGIRDGNIYGMTFDNNGNVLFGSQGGIWKSSKTGTGYTWTNVLQNQNTAAGKGLGRDAHGNLYYGHNHDANDPTVVYRSIDNGSTWSAYDSGIPPSLEGHEFIVNPADLKLYAVIEDGVTNNGWLYGTVNPVQ
jgi:hypothetical protein